jgi:DNA polymerase III delta prime subunit
MTMTFKRAARTAKKARIALYGPSGSGKTYTALALASGLGKATAFIDTERGSAQLYADKFAFDSLDLNNFHPDQFIEAIRAAEEGGYDVIIIDSLTHAWQAILDAVTARGGNTFSDGWGKIGTPLYQKLVGAILESKCHIIACMRSKTEYSVDKDERGKSTPKKLGMAPVMRADTEYEFDLVLSMDDANNATVSKTRMGDLLPLHMNRPDKSIGTKIGEWLATGKPAEPPYVPTADERVTVSALVDRMNALPEGDARKAVLAEIYESACRAAGLRKLACGQRSIDGIKAMLKALVDYDMANKLAAPEPA